MRRHRGYAHEEACHGGAPGRDQQDLCAFGQADPAHPRERHGDLQSSECGGGDACGETPPGRAAVAGALKDLAQQEHDEYRAGEFRQTRQGVDLAELLVQVGAVGRAADRVDGRGAGHGPQAIADRGRRGDGQSHASTRAPASGG
ncbi:hypothetical protein Scel_11500 [Streptomyces cellostaticus]|nr:hypothetical protein Scel_11500 [Streptomyces cellostaticus]